MIANLIAGIEAQVGPLPDDLRGALEAVDRSRFVRACDRAYAYEDRPLPLDTPHAAPVPPMADLLARYADWDAVRNSDEMRTAGSTISAPMIYMLGFHLLGLRAGDRVLELGTGTGYGAALAAAIVGASGHVTSVDVDPHLVDVARTNTAGLGNVTILHDDGLRRPDLVGEHTRIWLTFSVAEAPRAMVDALADGSVLLAPVGPAPPTPQQWLRFTREAGATEQTAMPFPVLFIPARPLVQR